MTKWKNSQRKRKEWTLKIGGVKLIELSIILLVIIWCIFMTGVQRGIWAERNRWENALREVSQEIETLQILETIIRRESNGRHNVWGADKEFGLAQFKRQTFFFLAEKMGLENPDWKDALQQILVCNWAIRNGYAKKHWSTYPEEN